jgi:hypothetical protein
MHEKDFYEGMRQKRKNKNKEKKEEIRTKKNYTRIPERRQERKNGVYTNVKILG